MDSVAVGLTTIGIIVNKVRCNEKENCSLVLRLYKGDKSQNHSEGTQTGNCSYQ